MIRLGYLESCADAIDTASRRYPVKGSIRAFGQARVRAISIGAVALGAEAVKRRQLSISSNSIDCAAASGSASGVAACASVSCDPIELSIEPLYERTIRRVALRSSDETVQNYKSLRRGRERQNGTDQKRSEDFRPAARGNTVNLRNRIANLHDIVSLRVPRGVARAGATRRASLAPTTKSCQDERACIPGGRGIGNSDVIRRLHSLSRLRSAGREVR